MTTAQHPIRPKALVFDMQGTVLDFYDPMMRELAGIPTVASHVQDWSTFAGQWSASAHDAIVEISARRKAWQPNGAVYADVMTPLLSRYPGGNTLSDDDKTRLLGVWGKMKPWNDSVAGLTSLRKEFVIATLTNASMAAMIAIVKREKLPFDAILTGELVHAFKPDPRVYQIAPDYLGFAPGEILMVSAHKWDLMAAKHSGLLTAFVPRPYENGPATKVDTSSELYIDVTASDLPHLASILDRG
ncbi:dehalogenase (plasmid) [Paraburkholderia sp. PGU19]|uniref:haloacid dehalogenase type II n=1 Tax=Paraburkholderia sp. PGU19 TaxID=2735434 RepID=UPI0015DAFA37|nr:haloacid dehalogenase type II [Paraburkholderia sp. PGU19]BCG03062.1 dehalogenase [Paraburkholderia sp. PGU19]